MSAKQAEAPQISTGSWVQCRQTLAYGVVNADTGKTVVVQWASGHTSKQKKEELNASSSTDYHQQIKNFAVSELNMAETELWKLHGPIANGRDKMSLAVLSELEEKLLSMSTVELDQEYEEVAQGLFEQAKDQEEDIFSAFEKPEETKPSQKFNYFVHDEVNRVWTGCSFSPDPAAARLFNSQEEVNAESFNNIPIGCKYFLAIKPVEEPVSFPKSENSPEATTATDNITSAAPSAETTAQTPSVESAPSDVYTEAGWVDPETGAVVEKSFILRKLGWTEWPTLSKKPTRDELESFKKKLAQVLDKQLCNEEQAARRRAACEEECKPLDSAAEFWEEQFVKPLGRMLAPHDLPRDDNGDYSGRKSVKLSTGTVSFEVTGGAYVHDTSAVKEHIKEIGVEKLAELIDAEETVSYNYPKLISALNKGLIKDLRGTGINPKDPLGKVKGKAPKPAKSKDKQAPEGGASCPVTCPEDCPNHTQLKIQGG